MSAESEYIERLEASLVEAKAKAEAATRAKLQFLSNMSHEIRTPMNAILGLLALTLDTEMTSYQRENLTKIMSSSNALLDILNDILDYSQIESGHMKIVRKPFGLSDAISSVAKLFSANAEQKRLRLHLDIDSSIPKSLIGDELRVAQVLSNLLSNAIKFTHFGKIEIKAKVLELDNKQAKIKLIVKDSGIGMDAPTATMLFNAFSQSDASSTRRYGGNGLGLSISHKLVMLMDGQMGVSSVHGSGSCFDVVLTFDIDESSVAAEKKRQNSESFDFASTRDVLDGLKILLVEDNELNQQVATGVLKKFGIIVSIANNGAEAVEMVRENDYDIVLMDMQMPVMDGVEATIEIRKLPNRQELPILAMTAAAMDKDRDNCINAGMNDHIPKPIVMGHLVATLLKWTNRKPNSIESTAKIESDLVASNDAEIGFGIDGFDLKKALASFANDTAMLEEYIRKFAIKNADATSQLRELVSSGDKANAIILVHSIKGNCGYMGAARMQEVALELEKELRGDEPLNAMNRFCIELVSTIDSINSSMPQKEYIALEQRVANEAEKTEALEVLRELAKKVSEFSFVNDELLEDIKTKVGIFVGDSVYRELVGAIDRFDHEVANKTIEKIREILQGGNDV